MLIETSDVCSYIENLENSATIVSLENQIFVSAHPVGDIMFSGCLCVRTCMLPGGVILRLACRRLQFPILHKLIPPRKLLNKAPRL